MGIKVGLIETLQNLLCLQEKLCSREEGQLQAEQIQREEKLNVGNPFRAGNIKHYLSWRSITSDRFITETVKLGLKIDFISKPVNEHIPQMVHSAEQSETISGEITKLLKKEVIKECDTEKSIFISAIFTRRKKGGDMHTILNFKQVNKHVAYQHFKMESLSDVFKIIQPNFWMTGLDVKDAFNTIPIHDAYQKYFEFMWSQNLYDCLGMPDGYSNAMRVFAKTLKPQFVTLQ